MTPSEVQQVIDSLQKEGKLPAHLTQGTLDAMAKSLNRYFGKAAKDKISQFTDKAREVAEQELKTVNVQREGTTGTVEEGMNPATARGALTEFLEDSGVTGIADKMNMDFFLRIAGEVAEGAANHMARNFDQTRVDEMPALELLRVYDRRVPRGSEKDSAGPENGWDDDEGRWRAACEEADDDDALQVFEDTGRMVALKNSGVWQALGDGAGDYDDTLGNPFPPFAFNSGMDCNEIDYEEAVELGLLEDGDEVEPAKIDFNDLLGVKNLDAHMASKDMALHAEEAGHAFHGNQWTDRAAAIKHIDERAKHYGGKNAYYATEEYVKDRPALTKAWKVNPKTEVVERDGKFMLKHPKGGYIADNSGQLGEAATFKTRADAVEHAKKIGLAAV